MYIDLVPGSISLLQSTPPNPHIFRPSFLDVRSHVLQTTRSISLQRLFSPQYPRRKNQVGITQRVIRMQMRYKNNLQFASLKRRNPILLCRRCPPYDSRTAVDQVRPIIHHHRHRRPPPLRIRTRSPRSQHHYASGRSGMVVGKTILSKPARTRSNRRRNQYKKEFLHPKPPSPRFRLATSAICHLPALTLTPILTKLLVHHGF